MMSRSRIAGAVLFLAVAAFSAAPVRAGDAPPKEGVAEPQAVRALTPDEIARQCVPATVMLAGSNGAATGCGVVIHEAGYILTANGVAPDGGSATTMTPKRGQAPQPPAPPAKKFTYRVIARMPQIDAALLKVDADAALAAVPLGWSDDLMLGEAIVAIGNPNTVSAGIISGLDHGDVSPLALPNDPRRGTTYSFRKGMIQTNTPGGTGSFGGPLINSVGRLIGLIEAQNKTRGAIGVTLAVPIDRVRTAAARALSEKTLGLRVGLTVDPMQTAKITAVEPGSPAEKAGLRAGDVLIQAGKMPVTDGVHYYLALAAAKAGEPLPIEFQRDGKAQSVSVAVEKAGK